MSENPASFSDLTYFSLMMILIVPLIIVFAIVVIRYLLKGNVLPVLLIGLATGVSLCGVFLFLTLKGPSVTVHQVARASYVPIPNPAIPAKLMQPRPVKALSTAKTTLVLEQPLVAMKPYDSLVDSAIGQVKAEVEITGALPEWVVTGLETTKQNRSNLLESSRPVFQSGLFATREEAMQDALSKAMQKLQANLLLRYPQFKSNMWNLNPELIRQTAYRRIYYQTVEHDFGNVLKSGDSFKQDMYRAYLEVEDSPVVRQTLLTKWKRNIGNERTAWLGGGFGLMTLFCISVAVYLRATHDPATIRQS